MKATNVTHIGPVSMGASMALPRSAVEVAKVLGLKVPDFATAKKLFGFRREKRDGVWGWRIEITLDKLTLCAPWVDGMPFPRRLADAQAWAYHFAKTHGFEPLQHSRARVPKPRPKPALRLISTSASTKEDT